MCGNQAANRSGRRLNPYGCSTYPDGRRRFSSANRQRPLARLPKPAAKRLREAYLGSLPSLLGLVCKIEMFANTSSVGRTQSMGME